MNDPNNRKSSEVNDRTRTFKILNWEISAPDRKKLITWTIEGLIISVITFAILWLPLFIE